MTAPKGQFTPAASTNIMSSLNPVLDFIRPRMPLILDEEKKDNLSSLIQDLEVTTPEFIEAGKKLSGSPKDAKLKDRFEDKAHELGDLLIELQHLELPALPQTVWQKPSAELTRRVSTVRKAPPSLPKDSTDETRRALGEQLAQLKQEVADEPVIGQKRQRITIKPGTEVAPGLALPRNVTDPKSPPRPTMQALPQPTSPPVPAADPKRGRRGAAGSFSHLHLPPPLTLDCRCWDSASIHRRPQS